MFGLASFIIRCLSGAILFLFWREKLNVTSISLAARMEIQIKLITDRKHLVYSKIKWTYQSDTSKITIFKRLHRKTSQMQTGYFYLPHISDRRIENGSHLNCLQNEFKCGKLDFCGIYNAKVTFRQIGEIFSKIVLLSMWN